MGGRAQPAGVEAVSAAARIGDIQIARGGFVATVTIDRPPVNSMSVDLMRDLADALEDLGSDGVTRAAVLATTGKVFCAGADLTRRADEIGIAASPGAPAPAVVTACPHESAATPAISTTRRIYTRSENWRRLCANTHAPATSAATDVSAAHNIEFTNGMCWFKRSPWEIPTNCAIGLG